jgi:hypothetical protein
MSFGCMAVALLTLTGVDASSLRSWLYLTTVALAPTIVLQRLSWRVLATEAMHRGRSPHRLG